METDWIFSDRSLETVESPEPRALRLKPRHRRCLVALKREKLADFLPPLPAPAESLHLISNGAFDYWTFVPTIIEKMERQAVAFYGSTWTMSRPNVTNMFELFDGGKIASLAVLTGTYFKRRESSVCNTLVEGLLSRGQRFRAFSNHAKVMLLDFEADAFVLEGSANFTANPRLEQTTIHNSRELYEFHKAWFEEMLR